MNIVITGGNRGIGLALVKQLCERGDNVYVACRNSSDELNETNATVITGVDVSNPDSLANALAPLADIKIDWLINNAGVLGNETLEDWEPATIDYQFRVNALGPLLVTQRLLPNIQAGGKIGLVTSRMGSMTDNSSGGYYGYRMSKAALNAAGVSLANDLKSRDISVALLHPGFVKTEMVNNAGDVEPETAAQGLIRQMEQLNMDSSGSFFHANGNSVTVVKPLLLIAWAMLMLTACDVKTNTVPKEASYHWQAGRRYQSPFRKYTQRFTKMPFMWWGDFVKQIEALLFLTGYIGCHLKVISGSAFLISQCQFITPCWFLLRESSGHLAVLLPLQMDNGVTRQLYTLMTMLLIAG